MTGNDILRLVQIVCLLEKRYGWIKCRVSGISIRCSGKGFPYNVCPLDDAPSKNVACVSVL